MSQSPRPVLLGYDGSPSSAAAIAAAGRLLPGGRAVICHVWQGLSKTILQSRPSELPGALREAAEELDAVDREDAVKTAAEGVQLARAAGFEAQPLLAREGNARRCSPRRRRTCWRPIRRSFQRPTQQY